MTEREEYKDAATIQVPPTIERTTSMRVPPFSAERPALWFAQLDAQFRIHKVTTEIDKFYHTVSLIDTRYAVEVEALISAPPVTTPYQELKEELIRCFSKSKEAKLQQLLDGEQIGDRTPSQFLRHLKGLVPDISEDVLKSRWLINLPEQTRALLAVQATATIEELAKTADKLHEILRESRKSTAAVETPTLSSLHAQIADLTKQVASLTQHQGSSHRKGRSHSKQRSKSSQRGRSQSRTKGTKDNGICWYHQKFGKDATKCRDGCKFSGKDNESH